MTRTNAGAVALNRAVKPRISLSELSKVTGIGRPRLRRLMSGALPDAQEMTLLSTVLEIPLDAWTTTIDSAEVDDDGVDADDDG